MATDWNSIRPWNGSVEKGFEELCSQVAAGESYPAGSRFVRKGSPDAGVECYWTLPGGDEHAWQAKFFFSAPTPGQWTQIDKSVDRALRTHPRLTRFTLCLPIDRSDARLKGQNSFLDKWNDRVATWKSRARKRGISVEFEYWGDHELTSRLNREENRGRHWFWFSREQFTLEWFRKKLAAAIENAGERYTPVLHVELPIARHFAAVGQTQAFYAKLISLYRSVREAADRFHPAGVATEAQGPAEVAQADVKELCKLLDHLLLPLHDPMVAPAPGPVPWHELLRIGRPMLDRLSRASSELWNLFLTRQREGAPQGESAAAVRNVREAEYYCSSLHRAIADLVNFCESDEAVLANRPALLLVGEAGQGKTHLLCDIAERDLRETRPRILLHGSHFADGEPWSQVARMLGLSCSADELLGAVEAAGRAYGCRVVILIDALNEGEGRVLWAKYLPGMLAALAESPWVGIAVSVRSSYEQIVVSEALVPSRLTRIVHHGFEEHEYEAVNRFFQHYGIQPTIPLLVPEFTNPLFLKLFCQGIKAHGWTQVPLGLRGITSIVDMFLDATNRKLWKPERMNYDQAINPVQKGVTALVRLMAKCGTYWLPREQAVEAVNQILPANGYDKSLFRNLVSEGVLTENRWAERDGYTEVVSFSYERFADHLLAKHYLDTYFDDRRPKRAFAPRTTLGKKLKDEAAAWRSAGLIEALSIQLPERAEKELFEVVPSAAGFRPVTDGFVKSLVWRDARAFTKATFKKLNELNRHSDYAGDILNAALTVTAVPAHPLNADKLHTILSRQTMADRDAWWSVFLHHEWQRRRAADRLIDWVWGESEKSSLSAPVLTLIGTALTWFLTTSNRFMRDRTTKALVRLFENRLDEYGKLLDRFWGVNDPYVLERLLAAGYGSAMRSERTEGLREMAEAISLHVFRERRILPQVLSRDHARGIVDCARHRSVVAADAFPECHPPYRSKWPNMAIPSAKVLEKWGERPKDRADAAWAQREVYSSIMESGFSDFSRYVIGDLMEWTSVRLGTDPPKTVKEKYNDFLNQLTQDEKKKVERYRLASAKVGFCRRLSLDERAKYFRHRFTDAELDAALAKAEKTVISALKTAARKRLFRTVAKSHIQDQYQDRLPHPFDGALARRWMVQRVIDYGWTAERFGEFDLSVNRWDRHGREANKPERIGKKYQWIAYHELLARLSDNFYMRKEPYSGGALVEYSGPWDLQFGSARDIDPSVVIRATRMGSKIAGRCWWSPVLYEGWKASVVDGEWIRTADDLPAVDPMLSVRSSDDGSEWLVLNTHAEWRQPARPGRKEYEQPQRLLWYIIGSYLVRRSDTWKFYRWAKRQNFMGRWMPEPDHTYHVHLGEHTWAPAYHETTSSEGWTRGTFERVPFEVMVTAIDFLYESSGFDCSIDSTIGITLPAAPLVGGMRLRGLAAEGQFADPSGRVVAFDPSVRSPGPRALLVRREALQQYLDDNSVDLCWTLLGEKQLIGGGARGSAGWLQVSGIYRLTETGVAGHTTPEYRTTARRRSPPKKRK
jgi:hypothetical protein